MLTRRRVVTAVVVLVLAAVGYSAWSLYAAQRDLRQADQDARAFRAALTEEDEDAARAALSDLQASAAAAERRTSGPWWGALTVLPGIGDDLDAVRAVSASLDELAGGAAPALVGLPDLVQGLVADGQVDVQGVRTVRDRLVAADASVSSALGEVDHLDDSGYVGPLRDRVADYVRLVTEASQGLRSARTAAEVAPTLLGADGPRDYLLVFQNNAEVRATGGLSGSWARVHAEDGRLELQEQGSAADFDVTKQPVLPLSSQETAVYGDVIGRYFQNPLTVPDFPRAASLLDAFWNTEHADVPLDGVLTLDTVALSYLLRATGPVVSDGYTLTPETVVQQMLNQVYLSVDDPRQQDALFRRAAASVFTAVTADVSSPRDLVEAARQAVSERRLLFASFDEPVADRLAGTRIAGELSGDDGRVPHVDVTVDDATGAKMSYYLDYQTRVGSTSCADGVQQLEGSMVLRQTIPAAEARTLPDYVTGGGVYGIAEGSQQVLVRLYAPHGGTLGDVFLDDVRLPRFTAVTIAGRPSITIPVLVDGSGDIELRWTMGSSPGQDGVGRVQVTPGVAPGTRDAAFASTC